VALDRQVAEQRVHRGVAIGWMWSEAAHDRAMHALRHALARGRRRELAR